MRFAFVAFLMAFLAYQYAKGSISKPMSKEQFESKLYASNEVMERQNMGSLPWQRHNASLESVPVDARVKYSHAYYYEMSNEQYQKALQTSFANSCRGSNLAKNANDWQTITRFDEDPRILNIYGVAIDKIKSVLNGSKSMQLPSGNPYMIQIVHDVLLGVQQHKLLAYTYLLEIDTILYREFAANAKHVRFTIYGELAQDINTWKVDVIQQQVMGIVSPESIYLHPILKVDPIEMQQMEQSFDPNPLVPFVTTLLDNNTIDVVVSQQQQKQKDSLEAAQRVAQS